jgi:hypothetical protein
LTSGNKCHFAQNLCFYIRLPSPLFNIEIALNHTTKRALVGEKARYSMSARVNELSSRYCQPEDVSKPSLSSTMMPRNMYRPLCAAEGDVVAANKKERAGEDQGMLMYLIQASKLLFCALLIRFEWQLRDLLENRSWGMGWSTSHSGVGRRVRWRCITSADITRWPSCCTGA